jgi:murein tripeptide amidase MpaA
MNLRSTLAASVCIALLAACAHTPQTATADARRTDRSCEFGDFAIRADFPTARASGCRRSGPDEVVVRIAPESSDINPSPWYAFRIETDEPRVLYATLEYRGARHRYMPRVSTDGRSWRPLERGSVTVQEDGSARLRLGLQRGSTYVAAREPWPAQRHDEWTRSWAARPDLAVSVLGRSREGREILMIRSDPTKSRSHTLVITGRQHPPEVSGAASLEHFVSELFADTPTARRFRATHRVVVVPLLNPDGVERGHWRNGAGGVDLNRDWGRFSQPEIALVGALIARIEEDPTDSLAMVVDFHSTRRDVFYTQRDEDLMRSGFSYASWLARLQTRLGGEGIARSPSHNPQNPTAKTWLYQRYRIPAMTYETGDDTPPERIERLARAAALTLMEELSSPGPGAEDAPAATTRP